MIVHKITQGINSNKPIKCGPNPQMHKKVYKGNMLKSPAPHGHVFPLDGPSCWAHMVLKRLQIEWPIKTHLKTLILAL